MSPESFYTLLDGTSPKREKKKRKIPIDVSTARGTSILSFLSNTWHAQKAREKIRRASKSLSLSFICIHTQRERDSSLRLKCVCIYVSYAHLSFDALFRQIGFFSPDRRFSHAICRKWGLFRDKEQTDERLLSFVQFYEFGPMKKRNRVVR